MGTAISSSLETRRTCGPPLNDNTAGERNEDFDGGDGDIASAVRRNLLFPNEILEKILTFLSVRDKLIAREVCTAWMLHINTAAGIEDEVRVRINSDEILNILSSVEPVYTRFYFHKLDLTRQSMNFWTAYNQIITHLDFYDCSVIPRRTADCEQPDFSLGCPNLKHLGLVNCDKYFLMGGRFIQLHEILHLENLQSLDLSCNKNLTDNILFSILEKTTRLESLDLSDCVNMVFMKAVHNRFYPQSCVAPPPPYSDNVLSFHTICNQFLVTPKAKHMKKFNFGMKFNSTGMELLLANDNIRWVCANLESPELKASDVKQFINKFRQSLVQIKLGRCKLSSDDICSVNLYWLQDLSLYDSRLITNLQFLKHMPNLRKLVLGDICGFQLNGDSFADLPNLLELSLNGIKPLGDNRINQMNLANCFKFFPNLTSLDVGNCAFVNDYVLQEIIRSLNKLRNLNLESTKISDVGMVGVSNPDISLRQSRLSPQQISEDDSLSVVGLCLTRIADLEHLNLSYCCDIGEVTWQNAIMFKSLKSLNLSDCSTLSKQGLLSIINNCRNLERLILMHCSRQIIADTEVITEAREKLYRCKEITY